MASTTFKIIERILESVNKVIGIIMKKDRQVVKCNTKFSFFDEQMHVLFIYLSVKIETGSFRGFICIVISALDINELGFWEKRYVVIVS